MFIFNKKEIYIGYDLSELSRIRDILESNGVKYGYKVINHSRHTRGSFGSFGIDSNYENQYVLSVKTNDYEKAQYLICFHSGT